MTSPNSRAEFVPIELTGRKRQPLCCFPGPRTLLRLCWLANKHKCGRSRGRVVTRGIFVSKKPSFLRSSLPIIVVTLFGIYGAFQTFAAQSEQDKGETIVLVRHGEKPPQGLGQLTCKGLNRALALPDVLIKRYGKPDFIYAPNPSIQVTDRSNTSYSYVRPLVTIEPTAIRLAMPVNAQIGFNE